MKHAVAMGNQDQIQRAIPYHPKTTQKSWLVDRRGTIIVDKLVKLENKTAFTEWSDTSHLAQKALTCDLSARAPNPGKQTKKAIHRNPSTHEKWPHYYNRRSCEIVKHHFAEDFEAFGYDTKCTQ